MCNCKNNRLLHFSGVPHNAFKVEVSKGIILHLVEEITNWLPGDLVLLLPLQLILCIRLKSLISFLVQGRTIKWISMVWNIFIRVLICGKYLPCLVFYILHLLVFLSSFCPINTKAHMRAEGPNCILELKVLPEAEVFCSSLWDQIPATGMSQTWWLLKGKVWTCSEQFNNKNAVFILNKKFSGFHRQPTLSSHWISQRWCWYEGRGWFSD